MFLGTSSMSERENIFGSIVISCSLSAHNIQVAMAENSLKFLANRCTILIPIEADGHSGTKSQTYHNFSVNITMPTDSAFGYIMVIACFAYALFSLISELCWQDLAHTLQDGHLVKVDDFTLSLLNVAFKRNISEAEIPS